jgi:RHS repeat-associated protein
LINIKKAGNYDEPYRFGGKIKDEESGLNYFEARYYDENVGFISVDALAEKFPHISGYAYCLWSPINFYDPDGNKVKPGNNNTGRNGRPTRPNSPNRNYVFYPGGVAPQAYRKTTSYKLTGLPEITGMATTTEAHPQYVENYTTGGGNRIQMSNNNALGQFSAEVAEFGYAIYDWKDRFSKMSPDLFQIEITYSFPPNGPETRYSIRLTDPTLINMQKQWETKAKALNEMLDNKLGIESRLPNPFVQGRNEKFNERSKIFNETMGISPMQYIQGLLIYNTELFHKTEKTEIIQTVGPSDY